VRRFPKPTPVDGAAERQVARRPEAIVLMGPPGSGKSYLGNRLAKEAVADYLELEPILRERFGEREEFRERFGEVGTFLRSFYRDQLASADQTVAFESTGITDRPFLEEMMRKHRVALIHVRTERALCIDRVIGRPKGRNIANTDDPELVGRFYDHWYTEVKPGWSFEIAVDGSDADSATAAIAAFLRASDEPWR
jgi:shikimate kinase